MRDRAVEVAVSALVLGDRLVVEGVEHEIPSARGRSAPLDDRREGDAAPLGDVRPTLDAVVLGDLAGLRHRAKLGQGERHRLFHQSAYVQAIVDECAGSELFVLGVRGRVAIHAEVRRDVALGVVLSRREAARDEPLKRIDDAAERSLHASRMIERHLRRSDIHGQDEQETPGADADRERVVGLV